MRERKFVNIFVCLLMVAAVFAVAVPMNVNSEEPGEDPGLPEEPEIPGEGKWWVEGNGTYFELTNSTYLNVTLTSSENVYIYLESVPEVVSYHIEANCTAITTDISLKGFEASKTYYRYQDGDLQESFTPGVEGSYSYMQNISTSHHVFIQETESTIYIRYDGSIVPSYAPISRVGNTYTLTANIEESIYIQKSGITLDGNGFSITGPGQVPHLVYGIYIFSRSSITIKNVEINDFHTGIYVKEGNYITIDGNTITGCWSDGISMVYSISNIIKGNTISGPEWSTCIDISRSNYNTISGNTGLGNGMITIYLSGSSYNMISGNKALGTRWGVYLSDSYSYYSKHNTVSGNICLNNGCGLILSRSSYNTISRNTISGNSDQGIIVWSALSKGNTISGNILSENYCGIQLEGCSANTIKENIISGNDYGMRTMYTPSNNNFIYHNNFINNTNQYYNDRYQSTNIWDNGAGEGNYWNDYDGVDLDENGIGDSPYILDAFNQDNYPLINLYPNTPIGTNVDVMAGVGVSTHFSEVITPGFTYTEQVSGSPPANFKLIPTGTFYEITSSASFVGTLTIGIVYDDTGIPLAKERNLKLRHLDETTGQWIDITTWVDSVNNVIYGETDHLSIFAIMMWLLNDPPIPNAGGPYEAEEGTQIMFDASGSSDPDGDELYYRWDFDNNGIWDTEYSTDPTAPHTWFDNFLGPIKVEVYDGEYTDTDTAMVTVSNLPPTITEITASIDPIIVNTEITTSGTFTDPGTGDTHTATWVWDDGSYSEGQVIGGTVAGFHPYTDAGVYTITLIVTDDDGGSDQMDFQYVVIYDPEGGFVTGGGWIDSPEGAYVPDPTLMGKASFGFVSKYLPGAAAPTGNTEFQFKVADLNFHSSNYEWLVIAGATAQFKGTGTINNEGEYKFKIWATDGDLQQIGGFDKFRIKIWEEDEFGVETVTYDNKIDTELGGGQIVIHKT